MWTLISCLKRISFPVGTINNFLTPNDQFFLTPLIIMPNIKITQYQFILPKQDLSSYTDKANPDTFGKTPSYKDRSCHPSLWTISSISKIFLQNRSTKQRIQPCHFEETALLRNLPAPKVQNFSHFSPTLLLLTRKSNGKRAADNHWLKN